LDSSGPHDIGHAPDPSRSRCAQCDPSTRYRAEVRRSPIVVEPCARSWPFCWAEGIGDGEVAVGAVRNHRLPRLQAELGAVELNRNPVRLERRLVGDAADLTIGLTIRPCRQMCVADVVVTAQPFVWAEGLVSHGGQRGLIDVGAGNVPARREAGLVEENRPLGIGDYALTMP